MDSSPGLRRASDDGSPPPRGRRPTWPDPLRRRDQVQTVVTLAAALGLLAVQLRGLLPTPWLDSLGPGPVWWWHLGPLAVIGAAMIVKPAAPLTALLAGGLCVLADLAIGGSVGIWLCLADLIYFFGLRGGRRSLSWLAGVFAALMLAGGVVLFAAGGDAGTAVSATLLIGSVLLLPLWWSVEVRRGYPLGPLAAERDRLDAERHAALVRVHELDRRRAVAAERQRMARELHDVISSHVSAIALHSGAALAGSPDQDRDRRALEEVRRTSVTALEDLRTMVNLLRGQDAESPEGVPEGRDAQSRDAQSSELLAPPSLEHVVEVARSRGLSLQVSGEVPRGDEPTRSGIRGVLSRVLQEALTNAAAHGDGAARVEFTETPHQMRLRVTNGVPDAPVGRGPSPALATGTGIITMRERLAQAGGTLQAGRDGDLWVLTADLPRGRRR